MGDLRVMQSFGEPRPTTNPYVAQLARALEQEPGVEHLPFSWRTALTGRIDVVHVHWGYTLLSARNMITRTGKRVAMLLFVLRLRLQRIPVVRTVHNLTAQDGPWIDRALVRGLESLAVVRIHLNPTTPAQAGVPSIVIQHGHYRDWFSAYPVEKAQRGRLGYVGLIKAYKGIDSLTRAYSRATTAGISLRIAGRPEDRASEDFVAHAVAQLHDAQATLRFVSDAELVALITSSELVVLPYRSMHNSGAALAALSLDRPVLVPANETNSALSDEVGDGWVHTFEGELDAAALDRALASVRTERRTQRPDLSARDWDGAGRRHLEAYEAAMATRAHRKDGR